MKKLTYQKHMAWLLLLLLSSGPVVLQAAPGGNKGGNGHGGSASGDRGKSAKGNPGGKTAKASPEARLEKNTKLAAKLEDLLPEGTDIQAAASGFKNLGQFVAAVHVSYNLDIAFEDLKAEMVDNNLSLGQAIHLLKPDVDDDEEAEEGEEEAEEDLATTLPAL